MRSIHSSLWITPLLENGLFGQRREWGDFLERSRGGWWRPNVWLLSVHRVETIAQYRIHPVESWPSETFENECMP